MFLKDVSEKVYGGEREERRERRQEREGSGRRLEEENSRIRVCLNKLKIKHKRKIWQLSILKKKNSKWRR